MKKLRITKTGALFQNIFLILCLLLVCVLAYMTFFMDRYVFQAQVQELDASNLRMLDQASEAITRSVGDLEQQVQLFLSDQTLLQYLLRPYSTGPQESMQILQDLKHYVSLNPDVSQLWLYAPKSNTVLSSDGYLITRSGSQAGRLLDQYEQLEARRSAPDARLSAMVMDESLYILIDFIPADWLGCFIFQMDVQRLGVDLGQGQPQILVTTGEGQLLLNGNQLAQTGERLDVSRSEVFDAQSPARRSGQQKYYRVANEKLGWQLLMEISDGPGLYDRSVFWLMMLPVLAVMLILGAVGAYFITRKIYTPINRLLTLVMDRSGEPLSTASVTDYLEDAYQQTIQDNARLRTQFSSLGRDMRQYLCLEAVHGQLSRDSQGISDFIPDGLFQVAMIRLGRSDVALQPSIKQKLQLSALENLAGQMPECLCCLEQEWDTVILVFHFLPEHYDPAQVQKLLADFTDEAAQKTGCQLVFGSGGVCDQFHQLKQSFEQAVRDLQYNAYLAADPAPDAARSVQNKAVEERIKQTIEQAILSHDDVKHQVVLIVQTAEQGAEDGQERLNVYRQTKNLFLEKLLFQKDVLRSLPTFEPTAYSQQTRDDFSTFCCQALESARAMAGKKKYRYVDEAKKFIQDNYMNCSLSANDISSHVGISPSYFSSLFNELLQESVTSYLNRVRVEQAKNMLIVTSIPVKEIGFRCGFNSANVFGRVFKKYTGQSPKQFRDSREYHQKGGEV